MYQYHHGFRVADLSHHLGTGCMIRPSVPGAPIMPPWLLVLLMYHTTGYTLPACWVLVPFMYRATHSTFGSCPLACAGNPVCMVFVMILLWPFGLPFGLCVRHGELALWTQPQVAQVAAVHQESVTHVYLKWRALCSLARCDSKACWLLPACSRRKGSQGLDGAAVGFTCRAGWAHVDGAAVHEESERRCLARHCVPHGQWCNRSKASHTLLTAKGGLSDEHASKAYGCGHCKKGTASSEIQGKSWEPQPISHPR